MKKIKIVSAIAIILFLSSCGNKLSRSKAKDIILAYQCNPYVEFDRFDLGNFNKLQTNYSKLVDANLLKYIDLDAGTGWPSIFQYQPTDKGKPYFKMGGEVPIVVVGCSEFREITGISANEHDKTATVKYSATWKSVTPFGENMGYKKSDLVKVENTIEMVLFDDGWRVKDGTFKFVEVSKYPFFTKDGDYISSN